MINIINNYIKNLSINNDNNYIIVYFKDNIYTIDGEDLTTNNFKLSIKSNNIYSDIPIDNTIKNNSFSYTLFFNLDTFILTKNTNIFIELINIVNFEYNELNNIQNNNYVSIYYNFDIKPNIIPNVSNNVSNNVSIRTYINKSSPLLAYNKNKKLYYHSQINNYLSFYGTIIPKYPKSYYESSYSKIFKPV
jgi:hypothetical protein